MPTIVIKSFPENLHTKLKEIAAIHRRSVTQETIHLIEQALMHEENAASQTASAGSKWASRRVLPDYAAMEQTGAFRGGTDSSVSLSEERDGR
jgi:plasmid stability protein